MLQKPNVLVLDEPTNHLDLESINALNVALQRYEGTVFLVTHDQDLLEEVGTRVWQFDRRCQRHLRRAHRVGGLARTQASMAKHKQVLIVGRRKAREAKEAAKGLAREMPADSFVHAIGTRGDRQPPRLVKRSLTRSSDAGA